MHDLALMYCVALSLLATVCNLLFLLPFPQLVKQALYNYRSRLIELSSTVIILFMYYAYYYFSTDLHQEQIHSNLLSQEIRARIWKLERNFHIGMFALISWLVLLGIMKQFVRLGLLKKNSQHSN